MLLFLSYYYFPACYLPPMLWLLFMVVCARSLPQSATQLRPLWISSSVPHTMVIVAERRRQLCWCYEWGVYYCFCGKAVELGSRLNSSSSTNNSLKSLPTWSQWCKGWVKLLVGWWRLKINLLLVWQSVIEVCEVSVVLLDKVKLIGGEKIDCVVALSDALVVVWLIGG